MLLCLYNSPHPTVSEIFAHWINIHVTLISIFCAEILKKLNTVYRVYMDQCYLMTNIQTCNDSPSSYLPFGNQGEAPLQKAPT